LEGGGLLQKTRHDIDDSAITKMPGNQRELNAGVLRARTFRDPENPNSTELISVMEKFRALTDSDDAVMGILAKG
jgi:hypothetical protein